jgi:hypothetical protein
MDEENLKSVVDDDDENENDGSDVEPVVNYCMAEKR